MFSVFFVVVFFEVGSLPVQRECGGVDAKAQSGRLRAVREDMPEMRAALFAAHFHAFHPVAGIGACGDAFGAVGLPETRPAGTGIKFGIGVEQCIAATRATVNARVMTIPVCAAEGRLGAALAAYLVLLRREFLAPFGIGFFDFVHLVKTFS